MVWVARTPLEREMLIKGPGVVVLAMDEQRSGADGVRRLRRTQQRVLPGSQAVVAEDAKVLART